MKIQLKNADNAVKILADRMRKALADNDRQEIFGMIQLSQEIVTSLADNPDFMDIVEAAGLTGLLEKGIAVLEYEDDE